MSGPLDSCGKGGSVRRHCREPGFPFPPPVSGPWVQCWSAESQGYLRGTTVTIAWNQCGLGLPRGFPASVGQTLLQVCLQMCKADSGSSMQTWFPEGSSGVEWSVALVAVTECLAGWSQPARACIDADRQGEPEPFLRPTVVEAG